MSELEKLKLELKSEIKIEESRLLYKKELLRTMEEKGVCIYTDFNEDTYKGNDKFIIILDIFEECYLIYPTKNIKLKDFNFNLKCSSLDTAIFFYNLLNNTL